MKKAGSDLKVKKTLVRNCEQKIPLRQRVLCESGNTYPSIPGKTNCSAQVENDLSRPTKGSSEALANYINKIKLKFPSSLSTENDVADNHRINCSVTKKLNFHFNEQIYNNLIELNANIEDLKSKKDRQRTRSAIKRDLEPHIEDFFEDEKEVDVPPAVPIVKPKFKPLKQVENGQLHKLIGTFENL